MLINSRGKIRLMLRNDCLNDSSLNFFISETWKKRKKICTDSKIVSKHHPKTKSGAGNGISNPNSNSGKHFALYIASCFLSPGHINCRH